MTPAARRRALGGFGLALLLLAGCEAPGGAGSCGAREVMLRNASGVAIEQAYGGSGAAAGWGAELLGPTPLPAGAGRTIRLPAGAQAVRLVWVNGRAAELAGVDLCAISTLTLTDAALRADR